MAELAAKRSEEVKEQELALPDDGFNIAPNKIKDQYVGREMPDAMMEQWRREKLPGISVIDPAIAQGEVIQNEGLAPGSEDELEDERDRVKSEQGKQDNLLRRLP